MRNLDRLAARAWCVCVVDQQCSRSQWRAPDGGARVLRFAGVAGGCVVDLRELVREVAVFVDVRAEPRRQVDHRLPVTVQHLHHRHNCKPLAAVASLNVKPQRWVAIAVKSPASLCTAAAAGSQSS